MIQIISKIEQECVIRTGIGTMETVNWNKIRQGYSYKSPFPKTLIPTKVSSKDSDVRKNFVC